MPSKYFPALAIVWVALIVNVALSFLFAFFSLPQFFLVIVNIFIWFAGMVVSCFVFPSIGEQSHSGQLKFRLGRTAIFTVLVFMINLAVSFSLSFVVVGILGGVLDKFGSVPLSYIVTGAINMAVYLVVMRYFLIRVSFLDTTNKRYNQPFFAVSMTAAYSFLMPFAYYDCLAKYPLGTDVFMFSNAHSFLSGGFDMLIPSGSAYINIIVMLAVAVGCVYLLSRFYKAGRAKFFQIHPHNLDYDAEEQRSINQ